jgi:hypothetical protein
MVKALWHPTLEVKLCMVVLVMPGCLVSYCTFVSLLLANQTTTERNMYLAEDRILCFEIVTKKREAWV